MLKIKEKKEKISAYLKENIREISPLEKDVLTFLEYTARTLFRLFDIHISLDEKMDRLEISSTTYCNLRRQMQRRYFDGYERNTFLPIDIIPEKGQMGKERGNTIYTGCERMFPCDEFVKKHVRNRECRVCKIVKHHLQLDGTWTEQRRERDFCRKIEHSVNEYEYEEHDKLLRSLRFRNTDGTSVTKTEIHTALNQCSIIYRNGHGYNLHSDNDDELNDSEDVKIGEIEEHNLGTRRKRKSFGKFMRKHEENQKTHIPRNSRINRKHMKRCRSSE
ncbi:unnamed protein product [Mytilus edulis]|uniref:Uncharacterized protein n=1 Tax=Mytilus edulis TaxID=6550 RepID=A0A8S3RJ63_MYTED|nr:unnamed protein product [Mytilus edulis]